MATILTDSGEIGVEALNGPWLAQDDAARATGFEPKPEGMCQGDLCVPLPAALSRDGRIDVAGFWRHLGRPVAHDPDTETWMLGAGADQRNTGLTGAAAPDFTLPDLAGVPHRLSALRGKKVFLSTWASW